MFKHYAFLGAFCLLMMGFSSLQGQDIYLGNGFSNNGTVTTSSGTFLDAGGYNSNYSKNEDYTVTFAAPVGKKMVLSFSYFNIENWYDRMYIYDGSSTSAQTVGSNSYTGTNSPGTVTASGRYLTVRFKSDYIVQKPGWIAAISSVNDNSSSGGSGGSGSGGSGSNNSCTCTNNLIENGGFENNATNWTYSSNAYYDFYSGYDDCGNRSTRVSRGSGSGLLDPAVYQQENNIVAGATYALKFDAATHRPQYLHRVYLRFYNAAGQVLSEDYREADHDVDVDGKLQNYSISMQAPATVAYARVVAVVNGDWIKLDNVCLQLNSAPPPPTCTLSATMTATENSCIPNDNNIQVSGQAILTAASAGGSGVNYSWSHSLGNGLSKTVNPTISTTYSVTATDNTGCTAVATKTITVQAETPPIQLSINQGDCSTGIGSLTITNLPSGYYSQINGGQWTQTSFYAGLAVGQHTVRMGLSGCNTTAVADIQAAVAFTTTKTFTEHSCTPNDGEISAGDTVTISVTPTGGSPIFKIKPTNSYKCLDVPGSTTNLGAIIVQWSCHGGSNQDWTFTPVTGGTPISTMTNGRYYIQNAGNNLYLAPKDNGIVNGTRVVQTNIADINAQWDVTYLDNGAYKIKNAVSGIGLDVGGPTNDDGAQLQLWGNGWGANQKFYLENGSSYTYEWSNGSTDNSISVCPEQLTTYSVTITNSQGCKRIDEVTITIRNNKPEFIVAQPTCTQLGSLTITNLPTGAQSKVDGNPWTTDKTFYNNLTAGKHWVLFRFPNETCKSGTDFDINSSATTVQPQLSAVDATCTQSTGSVSITNVPNGYYTQLNGGSWKQTSTYPNLAPGVHTICMGKDGCNACEAIEIKTANPAQPPVISVSNDTICAGNGVVLSAVIPSSNPSSCTLQWQVKLGPWWLDIAGAQGLTYNTPVLTTTSTYRAVLTCGTSACAASTSAVKEVLVFAEPQASIVGNNLSICEGGEAMLTANVQGGAGIAQYQWQKKTAGGSYADIVGATQKDYATGALNTSSSFRVNISFLGAKCSPMTSAEAQLLVNPDPSVSIDGPNQNCPTNTINLTAQSAGGAGNCSFQWQKQSNNLWINIPNSDNASLQVNEQAVKTYRVRYFCTGSGCDAALSATHDVNMDNVSLSISLDNDTICSGTSTMLHATPSDNNLGCVRFQKSPDGVNYWQDMGAGNNGNLTTLALTTNTFYRAVYACAGSFCPPVVSDIKKITILTDPGAGIVGGDIDVCEGATINLDAVASGGAGLISYQWQKSPDGQSFTNITGAKEGRYIAENLMQTTHFRAIISFSGFQCTPSISAIAKVTVHADPSISISAPDSACFGCPFVLYSEATGGTGSCITKWQVQTGNLWLDVPFGNKDTLNTFIFAPSTTFRVFKKCFAGGCGEAYSQEKTVYLKAGSSNLIQQDYGLTFDAYRSDSRVSLSWVTAKGATGDQFLVERSKDGGQTFEVFLKKEATGSVGEMEYFKETDATTTGGTYVYRVQLIKQTGQILLSENRTVFFPNAAEISLYPNPNLGDKLYVSLAAYMQGEACTIQIVNPLGITVQQKDLTAEESKSTVDMDISTLRTGTYSVQIQAAKHRSVSKLLQLIKE